MGLLIKRLLTVMLIMIMVLSSVSVSFAQEVTDIEMLTENATAEQTDEISFAESPEVRHAIDKAETNHVFTGEPITKVPNDLKEPDARGGTVLRFPNVYFDRPGTEWRGTAYSAPGSGEFRFVDQGGGVGYHEYEIFVERNSHNINTPDLKYAIPVKANRKYILSMLVWTDFTRLGNPQTSEVCCGIKYLTDINEVVLSTRHGLPDYTGGWKRVEFEISTGQHQAAEFATFWVQIFKMPKNNQTSRIAFADVCLIELPPEEVPEPYAEGEGMVFRGSSGNTGMKIVGATQTEKEIRVETTGTVYTFDLENDIITTSQKFGKKRDVSSWKVDTDLSTLKIGRQTEKECIVSNPEITFGVQMDGMMFLTPHKGEVALTCTSLISGLWNRYHYGHLNVVDGYGGFCVTPDIPVGTGLLSQCEVLTENLDFVTYQFENLLNIGTEERTGKKGYEMNKLVSNCKAGFQFKWTVRPAERLAISTFPPKETDWDGFFNLDIRNYTYDTNPKNITNTWAPKYELDYVNLFYFGDYGYANEYKTRYSFKQYENNLLTAIDAAKSVNMKPVTYMSMYFFPEKDTPDAYINEVKRVRDTYGIDGIYSDGTPSEWRWVSGYEMIRMLRELFPDGYIEVHNTGIHENGGAPLSSPSYFIPSLDAYANVVYKGELVGMHGLNPPLANLTLSQRNVSNSVGTIKGDAWYYTASDGTEAKVEQDDYNILALEWGARPKMKTADRWMNEYLPAKEILYSLWQEKGNEPDFFDKYWAPKAREIAKPIAAKYGHYTEIDEHFDEELDAKYYGFHNTEHKVADVGSGNTALQMKSAGNSDGSMIKRIAPVGGPMDVSYKFMVEERGNFEHEISDCVDGKPISLRFTRDGRISLVNKNGMSVSVGRYKKGTWLDIKFEIDTDTHLYNVFINGKKVAHNLKIADNVYNISEFEFTDGGMGGVCWIDDLKVVNRYE